MGYDNQLIVALGKLEGCHAKAGITLLLIDLLDTRTILLIDSKVEAGANIFKCRTRKCGEWCMFYLKDVNDKVALGLIAVCLFREHGFLTGGQHKQGEERENYLFHSAIPCLVRNLLLSYH